MTNDDLTTALRDRVRDEHPDVDHLIQVSTRTGARLRRRRTVGVAIAGVAAAAVTVGIVGASLGGSGGTPGSEPGFATQPSAAASTSTPRDVLPTLTNMAPSVHDGPTASAGRAPVRVMVAGWECDEPMDQKFGCTRDGAIVSVNWRPAAYHADYLDPNKADVMPGLHTFVSAVHGRFFVTVAPGTGATQAQVDEVAAGLVWRR
jgi:hypothetical protein